MANSSNARFSLTKLNYFLSRCRRESGDIDLKLYLETYTELNKFFPLLGGIFGFVVSDVKDKIAILEHYLTQNNESSQYYETVQSMINYEVSNDITAIKGKPPSASRTLLRLHRALEFIILFLLDLKKASDSDRLGPLASRVYYATLAKHHMWIIRKAVSFALTMLPTRKQLLDQMSDDELSPEANLRLLEEAIAYAQPIYDTIQKLYVENDLLELP